MGSWPARADGGWCGGAGEGSPGAGPWVMADLENGLWGCGTPGSTNDALLPSRSDFVFAMVKGGSNGFSLKQGDAASGTLTTTYDGARP